MAKISEIAPFKDKGEMTPAIVGLRAYAAGMTFETAVKAPVLNYTERYAATSALSKLKNGTMTYTDVTGVKVKMIMRFNDGTETTDDVTLIGCKPGKVVVEFETGDVCSVKINNAVFCKE